MRVFVLIAAFLLATGLNAQSFTYGPELGESATDLIGDDSASLLMVPFKPDFYRGELDRSFCEANGLEQEAFAKKLRESLMNAVLEEVRKNELSAYVWDRNAFSNDLKEFYDAVKVSREPYKEIEDKKKKGFKLPKRSEEPKEMTSTTYIQDGQVRTDYKAGSDYMQANFRDKPMAEAWMMRFDADRILSINQLDVLFPKQVSPYRTAETAVQYEVRVHFDVFGPSGARVKNGKESVSVVTAEYDWQTLEPKGIQEIAKAIALKLQ
jgi:glycine/D-amino acid oxidase-like deaminating enzyme